MGSTREKILFERICEDFYGGSVPKFDRSVILFWLLERHNFVLFGNLEKLTESSHKLSKMLDDAKSNERLEKSVTLITSVLGKPKAIDPRKQI